MANEMKTIVQKIGSAIENGVAGSKAFDYPILSVNQVPAGIVLIERVEPQNFMGNSHTIEGVLRVICLTNKPDDREAWLRVYDYMASTGSGTSFVFALTTDPKFGTACDDTAIQGIENIGVREIAGGQYVSFDVIMRFTKSVP